MSRSRLAIAIPVAAALTAATALTSPLFSAQAEPPAAAPTYGQTTSVGVHNAYEQGKYEYFADALDSGASLLELDVWTNPVGKGWRVSHSNPVGNDNNCENAGSAAELRTKDRDQRLDGCLADMRAWHDANPGHPPVLIKVELKDGFYDKSDRGPDELDALISEKLGDAALSPAEVVGDHANLDEAVGTSGWPQRDALAGKFVFELIPGTVEEDNPGDDLWTDEEYATHLKDLSAKGTLGDARAFPAVHGAEKGDPRTERYEEALRPWFVMFDGDAATFAGGEIDTAWYKEHGYLIVMTDAHKVDPEIDNEKPTEQEARDRVTQLAASHASFTTSDWAQLSPVLSMVVPRG
jgi:hypothetical protein